LPVVRAGALDGRREREAPALHEAPQAGDGSHEDAGELGVELLAQARVLVRRALEASLHRDDDPTVKPGIRLISRPRRLVRREERQRVRHERERVPELVLRADRVAAGDLLEEVGPFDRASVEVPADVRQLPEEVGRTEPVLAERLQRDGGDVFLGEQGGDEAKEVVHPVPARVDYHTMLAAWYEGLG